MKLFNDDCLKVLPTIPDNSIDLVLTDPPYGMNYQSGRRKIKHNKITNDNSIDWLYFSLKEFNRVLKENSHCYIFCSIHYLTKFIDYAKESFKLKDILIWEKNNHGSGDLTGGYAPKYEFILFLTKGRKELNGKRDPNILKYNKTNNILHPTQKPTDLLEFLIKKSSKEKDLILDSFMGSGSTGVACKNLNRNFIGIELDQNYFNIAKQRIESTTSKSIIN
jgi:site-specific DNA-methyltransferase (adenine-specific)